MWTLCEIFRGWFLTGFPWLSLGYSQIDTPLAGYAPVLGVYGVSWLVASCAGLGCLIVVGNYRTRLAALCAIATIWLGGFLLGTIEWSEPHGEPLKIRLVQGNIAQYQKFMADLLIPSIETHKRLSETSEKIDLIVWPESAIPTFFYRIDEELREFTEQKSAEGVRVLTGGFVYDRASGDYYNSLRMLDDPDAYYHKKHLVPFGEFLPFRSVLDFLSEYIAIPMSDLSSGANRGKGISVNGQRIGASICYEDAFGAEQLYALPEASLLINVSNDAWFGDSIAPHQHLQMARMRALEVGRYVIRATNTGISAFIGPHGKVIKSAAQFKRVTLTARVVPRKGLTPYASTGNWPVIGLCLFIVAAFWLRTRAS
jgi:apolipoprotein N-acyltransferase